MNTRLAEELTTINQYMVHTEMCENWKYKKLDETIQKRWPFGRYGVTSNSLVSAVNARRLGWSPKGPSLPEYFESQR